MLDKYRIEIIVVLYGEIIARTFTDQCFEPNEVMIHMAKIAMDELLHSIEKAAEVKRGCGQPIPYEDLPSIHFDPFGVVVRRDSNQYYEYRFLEAAGM